MNEQERLNELTRVLDDTSNELDVPASKYVEAKDRYKAVGEFIGNETPLADYDLIITTLAARAYRNESDLGVAMLNVVPRMRDWIENRDGVWWVANPVNPLENFADKWEETPRKAEVFFRWLSQVELEHKSLLTTDGFAKIGSVITKAYGVTLGKVVMEKFANRIYGISTSATLLVPQRTTPRPPSVVAPVVKPKPWRS